ncbi:MAG: hypothetical protein IPP74_10255 [Alphaproteobacteria bacterium]|nr:hypothetical protein [Alphaproteobacteria bacterium]
MKEISLKDYAARKGVTRQAIIKAINSGRLSKSVIKKGKLIYLDEELANAEYEINTNKEKSRKHDNIGEDFVKGIQGGDQKNVAMAARNALITYKAKIAQLEYNERMGLLVEAQKVRDEMFKTGRVLRDSLLNIADRLGPELVGITDPKIIHKKIKDEIIFTLVGFDKDMYDDGINLG